MKKNNFYYKLWYFSQDKELIETIAQNFSKENIYIPKYIHEMHKLNEFGETFRDFLLQNYKGKTIYIPRFHKEEFKAMLIKNNQINFIKNLKNIVINYINWRRK